MSNNKRARCPICGTITGTYRWDGRRFYQQHTNDTVPRTSILTDPPICEATGWLVEDDELVVVPSPLRGVAQPARSVCRPCSGEGLAAGGVCVACNGTGVHAEAPR